MKDFLESLNLKYKFFKHIERNNVTSKQSYIDNVVCVETFSFYNKNSNTPSKIIPTLT